MSERSAQHTLDTRQFQFLCDLVYRETGIVLGEKKREMVYRRLMRRTRELKLACFSDYIALLKEESSSELPNFINAITTNLTSFFRENHHFDFLRDEYLPSLQRKSDGSSRVRIWSAGCSTGEEPYSIAITLMEAGIDRQFSDIRVLASDLDSEVLATASKGVYPANRVEKLPENIIKRYFLQGKADNADKVKVIPELQEMIAFKQFNFLSGNWPMRGPFDIIFCRNVLIYFDRDTQNAIVRKFIERLRLGGFIMFGHSESVGKSHSALKMVGRTLFQKVAEVA